MATVGSIEVKGLTELIADFRRLPGEVRKLALQAAVEDGADIVQGEAIAQAPKKTGKLAASLTIKAGRNQTANQAERFIGPGVDYAAMVHNGTRAHVILPKRANVLRFVSGGAVVFARRVNHPGTKANPFMTRAVDNKGESVARKMMNTIWQTVFSVMRR